MSDSRPTNIGFGTLMKYKFPPMAIASILHRISGVILFLMIPFLLWVFDKTLASQHGFNAVHAVLSGGVARFFLWVFFSALVYHFIAGLKHLFMDLGYFEEKCSGKMSSTLVMLVSLVLIVLLGVWLW